MKKALIFIIPLVVLISVGPAFAAEYIPPRVMCTAPFFQADGRINGWHMCAPIAAYLDGEGGLWIYWAVGEDYHMGDFALWVSAEDIAATDITGLGPTDQALVTSGEGIKVYLTGEGLLKVEIPGEYSFYFAADLLINEPDDWPCAVMPNACGNHGMVFY